MQPVGVIAVTLESFQNNKTDILQKNSVMGNYDFNQPLLKSLVPGRSSKLMNNEPDQYSEGRFVTAGFDLN